MAKTTYRSQIQQADEIRLHEIPMLKQHLEQHIEQNEGELSEEVLEWLREVKEPIESKLGAAARVAEKLEARKKLVQKEIDRLRLHQQKIENNVKRIKDFMMDAFELLGEDKIETDALCKLSRVKNSQPSLKTDLPMEEMIDEIPDEFIKVKKEIDYQAVLDRFKEGQPLPDGISLEYGHHVRIYCYVSE